MLRIWLIVLSFAALSSGAPQERTDSGDENVPLLKAHQELLLARARMAEQDDAGAVVALRQTEKALADFERQDHGPLGDKAELMRQDIESFISHMGRDASIGRVDEWIRTIERWQATSKHPLQPPEHW